MISRSRVKCAPPMGMTAEWKRVPCRKMPRWVSCSPMSATTAPFSRSSRLRMASALASGEYINSEPCSPAFFRASWMFMITGLGATMSRTSASRVSPNMPTGLRMSRWPLMWKIWGMRWRTSSSLASLQLLVACSSTRSRSAAVMILSPLEMVMESRRFSPLNWMPSTATRMPSTLAWPAVFMASSTAFTMARVLRSMSVIWPWVMPPWGEAWPVPVTLSVPSSSWTATTATTLLAPRSRPRRTAR